MQAEQLSVSQKFQMEKGELEKQLRLQADALRDTVSCCRYFLVYPCQIALRDCQ